VIATLVRPLHEGVARVLDLALLDESQWRESWQPTRLVAEFGLRLTSVEDFIDEQVNAWRRKARR
jgi:hypothetical protein